MTTNGHDALKHYAALKGLTDVILMQTLTIVTVPFFGLPLPGQLPLLFLSLVSVLLQAVFPGGLADEVVGVFVLLLPLLLHFLDPAVSGGLRGRLLLPLGQFWASHTEKERMTYIISGNSRIIFFHPKKVCNIHKTTVWYDSSTIGAYHVKIWTILTQWKGLFLR